MLSLQTLKKSPTAVKSYYCANHEAPLNAAPRGLLYGEGAARLGLTGTVSPEKFMELLAGKLSDSIQMEQTQKGQYHRPGYDLTFSAPKSVSILAIILQHEGILNAHRTAVQQVLTLIEQEYAATRVKLEGQVDIQKTDNLIFAIFEHTDSRALDPNLHSHCILMNATQREDGEWRTLYSYPLYQDKILLGMHYRCFLAQALRTLGFEIVQTSEKGTFELKDFPAPLMKQFSKRRRDIETVLDQQGFTGGKAAKVATLETRPAKQKIDAEHLTLAWTVELQQCGFSREWLAQYAMEAEQRGPITPPNLTTLAHETVQSAILHLSEWQAVFSVKDLLKASFSLSLVNVSEALLREAIETHVKEGTLLYGGNHQFTTQAARDVELENIATMRLHRNQVNPIFSKLAAQWVTRALTPSTKKIVYGLLTSTDRQVVVCASDKKAFQSLVGAYCRLIEPYQVYPIALTKPQRAQSFAKELGLPFARTLEGFLFSCQARAQKEPPVSLQSLKDARAHWIIDSEIPVTLTQVRALQSYAERFGARILWGYNPFKKPFAIKQLLQHGIRSMVIEPNPPGLLLTHNRDTLIAALQANHSLTEISDPAERIHAIAKRYLANRDTDILAVCPKERRTLNQTIRAMRVEQGDITGPTLLFNTLQPVSLTREQRRLPQFYQCQDVVRFTQDCPEWNLKANTYLTVQAVHLKNRHLTLVASDQEYLCKLTVNLAKAIQLYRPEKRPLQLNDVIRWNQTLRHPDNRALDRVHTERATVIAVHEDHALVRLANQSTLTLDPTDWRDGHWEEGYAQGMNDAPSHATPTLIALNSQTPLLTYERLIKTLASSRSDTPIFCDDALKLQETMARSRGKTASAFEQTITSYSPASWTNRLQELFPKLHTRMQSAFAKHPELLQRVMAEYEQEHAIPPMVPVKASAQQTQAREACQMIDWLCAKYAERDAVFEWKALKKDLLLMSGLHIPKEILQEELQAARAHGVLLAVNGDKVTTQEMAALEKACIYLAEQSSNTREPVLLSDNPLLVELKNDPHLTQGQKSALELALTTKDTVVGIQGVAGAGKTTLLRTLHRYCRNAGYELLGLSNSTAARQQLQQGSRAPDSPNAFLQAGIQSLTTRKFLLRCEALLKKDPTRAHQEYGGHRILILDEASFTSTRDMFALLTIANQLNIRCVMMGDYKQLNSVEAGRIFYLLLGSHMQSVAMTENVRFNSPATLRTMQSIYQNQIGDALEQLHARGALIEIPDREERLEYIAELYLAKDRDAQKNTLVITPLHQDRNEVNALIHKGLKTRGCRIRLVRDDIDPFTDAIEAGKEIVVFKGDGYLMIYKDALTGSLTLLKPSDALTHLCSSIVFKNQILKPDKGKKIQQRVYQEVRAKDGVTEIQGYLQGEGLNVPILTPVNRTSVEKEKIYVFEPGQWLLFNQTLPQGEVTKGTYCKILSKNFVDQTLVLQKLDGSTLYWSPERAQSRAVEVYEPEEREVLIHETIRFLKNDEPRGIRNGETASVLSLDKTGMTVRLQDGSHQILEFDNKAHQHWDYAYAATAYIAQGENKPDTIAHGIGGDPEKVNRQIPKITSVEEFLVSVTRGDNVVLVVDYLDGYQEALLSKLNDKRSAQEYLDPNREAVKAKVELMTAKITGRAERHSNGTKASSATERPHRSIPSSKRQDAFERAVLDKKELQDKLHQNILGYATQWLGRPQSVTGSEARWGKKGSLVVQLSGAKAGCWYDFEIGKGGQDLIGLYAECQGMRYAEGIKALTDSLGIQKTVFKTQASLNQEKRRQAKAEQAAKKLALQEAQKIEQARAYYAKGIPIANTLAETYLRVYRGITGPLPEDFRFSPKLKHRDTGTFAPVLIAPIRNGQGDIQGIVRIFLDKTGDKLKATVIDALGDERKAANKMNLGSLKNAAVIVNPGQSTETLYLAEGIETALSVAMAVPESRVLASLSVSQLRNVPIPPNTQTVVICADEDGEAAHSNKSLVEAANRYLAQGLSVQIAYPQKMPSVSKIDFNDVLKQSGPNAIAQSLKNPLMISERLTESTLAHLKNHLQTRTLNHHPEPVVKELER